MKQQTIVFKVSDNLKDEMIEFYQDRFLDKKPPYSVFQVKDYDCVITLYESGKVMFQGLGADIEASYWTEQERIKNSRDVVSEIDKDKKKKEEKAEELKDDRFRGVSTIGSDEVGTGDYFGPIVVTASYVSREKASLLYELGVRDSKKLNDEKIRNIAPTLIREYPHVTYILNNSLFNKWGITNMNQVKAILHNRVLTELLKKDKFDYKYVVVDQFCYPTNYFKHISAAKEITKNITFTTHAEDKCLSVAVSSIISRYIFLTEMDKLSKSIGTNIPLGAGSGVDKVGADIVKQYGKDKLYELAKLNFKNTDKIKELL
ncbi:MAG: ribonuclease HIII [Erysipelotrichales bacterium]|nr:ribonuclease HIII [Erysipelotrichales bacterium]